MGWFSANDGTRAMTRDEERALDAKKKSMSPEAWRRYENEQHRLFVASQAAHRKKNGSWW